MTDDLKIQNTTITPLDDAFYIQALPNPHKEKQKISEDKEKQEISENKENKEISEEPS